MLIAATSDIHSPRYLNDFFLALKYLPEKVDIILLAGDLADKGKFLHFDPVYNSLINRADRIFAVFGNEDFTEEREKYKKTFPKITWLEDSKAQYNDIVIIGSEGIIKKPTPWQKLKGINEDFYNQRKQKLEELLCEEKDKFTILLTHYATSYKTVFGERKYAYPGLGYEFIEESKCKPSIAIHGHAHLAKITYATVDHTKIYNVALPANKKFVLINIF
ncbi:metallophosphoesterase [Acidianus sulfidivorans JP7]|uniref:Metallophosphoesterase n=1 Tax=Acidianus sulfidivorans JP7 TaxID=619593 RepID=A0A2U9IK26_9CREN|nr:metallophosphoesterase [Acidianus sulfidivorans]AWR96402.1 metallophosphoesterase [Acidianus sulfidivorans JP7]